MQFKKTDDQTNIAKYRVLAKYRITNYIKTILPKHHYYKIHKNRANVWTFSHNYRVSTLSTLYLNVIGILNEDLSYQSCLKWKY